MISLLIKNRSVAWHLVEVSTLDMLEDGMGSIELTDESLAHFEGKSVMFEV